MKVRTLTSGSSGNSIFIKSGGTSLLIDAGLSGKGIKDKMEYIDEDCDDISAILVTHEHTDHIKGVGVLSRRYNLPVFATERTWQAMMPSIGNIAEKNVNYIHNDSCFEIGELKIENFSISHDAADPVGYTFCESNFKLGLVTDTGCMTSDIIKKLQDNDCLIIESNHDVDMVHHSSYPAALKRRILSNKGHLSNVVAGHSLASLISGQTKAVTLAHLSQENNSPKLAFNTVKRILEDNGLIEGSDIKLGVASRCKPFEVWG